MVVTVLVLAGPAQASPIVPSQTVSPVPFGGDCPCSDFLALTFLAPWSAGGSLNGVYNAAVVDRDPGPGVLLDFYYQVGVSETSTSFVNRLTMLDLAGWATDVIYYDAGGDSNEVPSSADRNASGSTIGFDFVPPIVADGVSHVVVIRTNASNFTTGSFSIFGPGGSTTVDAYQPSAAVPEPASLLLLGTGVIALRRRFGRR